MIETGRETLPPNKNRETNIDLLRTICAISVVFLHFCEVDKHNAFGFAKQSSYCAYIVLYLLYVVARNAVPLFFILSGYLSVYSRKQKVGKIISLFALAFTYLYIPRVINALSGGTFNFYKVFVTPFTKSLLIQNYYLYLFAAIYFCAPFLNNMVLGLNQKQYKRLLVILFICFSLWSTAMNTYTTSAQITLTGIYFTSRTGTSMGFNIANFTMLYLVGGYLRLFYGREKIRHYRLYSVMAVVFLSAVTCALKIQNNNYAKAILYYDSSIVIINAIAMFVFFAGLDIKPSRVLAYSGQKTFDTYVIHWFSSACIEKAFSIEAMIG